MNISTFTKTKRFCCAVAVVAVAFFARAEEAYIASGGTQAINTGYLVGPTTRIEIDFQLTEHADQVRIFGNDGGEAGKAGQYCVLYVGDKDTKINMQVGDTAKGYSLGVVDTARHTFVLDYSAKTAKLFTGSTLSGSANFSAWACTQKAVVPLGLFGRTKDASGSDIRYMASMKLYALKIYESAVLVHDYVPAVRSGRAGLLDRETGKFLFDARLPHTAAYDFSSGGDLLEAEDDAYVEFNGTQTVNARYLMTPDAKVELDYALLKTAKADVNQWRLFGADGNSSVKLYTSLYMSDAVTSFGFGDTWTAYYSSVSADLLRHRAILDAHGRQLSIETVKTVNWTTPITNAAVQTATWPLGIGGRINDASGTSCSQFAKMRVYGFKIWKAGVLVHDYRPCIVAGIVGFKDEKDGAFVVQETGSPLVGGGRIKNEAGDGFIYSPNRIRSIRTGYMPGPNVRIEADVMMLEAATGRHFFGCEGAFNISASVGSHGKIAWTCQDDKPNNVETVVVATNTCARRTIVVDSKKGKVCVVTAGFTNQIVNMTTTRTKTANKALAISAGNLAKGEMNYSSMRIYGLKIFDNDVLVRNFVPYVSSSVPCLLETVESKIYENHDSLRGFLAEGDIAVGAASDNDACIEAFGAEAARTTYKVGPKTRIEVDFKFKDLKDPKDGNQRVFGGLTTTAASAGNAEFYVNTSHAFVFDLGDKDSSLKYYYPGVTATTKRYTAVMDNEAAVCRIICGATTNSVAIAAPLTTTSPTFLGVFNRCVDAVISLEKYCNALIYSVRIFENGALVRNYLPCRDGSTVGFYDTVNGGAVVGNATTSTVGFKMDGAGCFGSGPAVYMVSPDKRVRRGESVRLEAFAAGAVSYKWTCNGVLVEGAVSRSIDVAWARRKSPHRDVYAVSAVFNVRGKTVESEPACVNVTHEPDGLVIIVR